jgi:hypothetical protein
VNRARSSLESRQRYSDLGDCRLAGRYPMAARQGALAMIEKRPRWWWRTDVLLWIATMLMVLLLVVVYLTLVLGV